MEIGAISISKDGREWKRVFEGGKVKEDFTHGRDNLLRELTYAEGKFVLAGNQGIGVMISEDGRSWWRFAQEELEGRGGFCTASTEGTFLIPTARHFHISSGGEVWECTSMDSQLKKAHGVGAWGNEGAGHGRKVVGQNGVFVFAGKRRFGSTDDGKTFLHLEISPPGEKHPGYHLVAGEGRFLYLHAHGYRTSTDGVAWEPLIIESEDPGA